ncbi:MAG TPA: hypothetical protein VGM93_08105 [Acidimicrobiales bacterium]
MADGVRTSSDDVDRDVDRRRAIRRIVRSQAVRGPRELRRLLGEAGFAVDPDTVRSDLAELGAFRDGTGDDAAIALPEPGTSRGSVANDERSTVAATVLEDPDWPLQLVVVAVVALFILVGLIGWLAGGSGSGSGPAPTAPVTTSLIH